VHPRIARGLALLEGGDLGHWWARMSVDQRWQEPYTFNEAYVPIPAPEVTGPGSQIIEHSEAVTWMGLNEALKTIYKDTPLYSRFPVDFYLNRIARGLHGRADPPIPDAMKRYRVAVGMTDDGYFLSDEEMAENFNGHPPPVNPKAVNAARERYLVNARAVRHR